MDDFRKIIYGTLIAFIATIVVWVGFLTISSCGYTPSCLGVAPKVDRTSIPTLIPATLPAQVRFLGATATVVSTTAPKAEATTESAETESDNAAARPSNPGGPGPAIGLTGDPNSGKQIFADNCQRCHNAEGKGGIPNPGSTDGSIPALNPIDPTIANADYKTFATNVDLFVEHGSRPEGINPTFSMLAWGDQKLLTPQQIADVIAYIISLNPVSNASATEAPTPVGGVDIARPSNPGGPGDAINLKGDTNSGAQIFAINCVLCHNTEGKGGIPNPGSNDGTIPPLNPIDQTMVSTDYKTFATNIDLFVQHGSTPAGPSGANPQAMPAWGDSSKLSQQQIADVISYIISLNPVSPSAAQTPSSASGTATPAVTQAAPTATLAAGGTGATSGVPHPSNPGGPGGAVNLTGDATSGAQIFASNCVPCHNTEGKGGIPNPGSTAGTFPTLNPINPALKSSDHLTFVTNLDLFIQHGSTPAGPPGANPTSMPAWGDKSALTQQQIADVIAYIISLNP